MFPFEDPVTAQQLVTTTLQSLTTQMGAVIPVALALSALVFGAQYMWSKTRKLSK